MIRVDWKYKPCGENDRVLLMLPPLYTNTKEYVHPCFTSRFRKTLTHIVGNNEVKYIVAYIPGLNARNFKDIDLLENIYGFEFRIVPTLQYFDRDEFTEHISNECVYILEFPSSLSSPYLYWDSYFDTCISDQVYHYYDDISERVLNTFSDYGGDIQKSSNFSLETFHAIMTIGRKIIPENILQLASSKMNVEGDIVLVIGNIQDIELEPLYLAVKDLALNCRISGIYLFGESCKRLNYIDETYAEITYRSYDSTVIDKESAQILWKQLSNHPSRNNTYIFLGSFHLNTECKEEWEKLEKDYRQHTVYTPISWLSLHNSIWDEKTPGVMSTECIGMLYFLSQSLIESSEEETIPIDNDGDYSSDGDDIGNDEDVQDDDEYNEDDPDGNWDDENYTEIIKRNIGTNTETRNDHDSDDDHGSGICKECD